MSSKKYVPNRLRGVLGGEEAPGRGRGKPRKTSRPWRVDAASWKQQLQERKAVYDNFALQEKTEEEREAAKELESIPLNVLTSTEAESGGRVDTVLTPKGGGQVETVYTSVSPTTSSQPSSVAESDQKIYESNDDKRKTRRPSPMPRNRNRQVRKGKRPKSNNDSSDDDWSNDEVSTTKSADSDAKKEYYIDVVELATSKTKDSDAAIINGETTSRSDMQRNGDSYDNAIILDEDEGNASSNYPVDKSSMMDAVDIFIDAAKVDSKSVESTSSTRRPIFAQRGADAEVVSSTRRGGRRRQRPRPETPSNSATNTNDSDKSNDPNNVVSGGDDEWSIRPVPSEEETAVDKPQQTVRPEADTETMASGDTDIVSVATNDVMFRPGGEEDIVLRERIEKSLSPAKREKEKVTEVTTPDPLQQARKSLLVSNLNRSVRSLDISSHSQNGKDNETVGDSSIETSYSTSGFVPLRSIRASSNTEDRKEIRLNDVLNDHGVYVSKYNKDGIFVPPKSDAEASVDESPENDGDEYNEHGAYIPQDKSTVVADDILKDNGIEEEKDPVNGKDAPEESSSNEMGKMVEEENVAEKINGEKDIQESNYESSNGPSEPVPSARVEEKDAVPADKDEAGGEQSEGHTTSQEQCDVESTSSKSFADDQNHLQDGNSPKEVVEDKIEESTESNNGGDDSEHFTVDEIDANRIRLVSDLKERVGAIYIGNHVCVESVGTSVDPDPLEALRRKRAIVQKRFNPHLRVQLNDTVSAMNTDHHHVVESPGKMVSGKSKKWKERMAMKKLAKKGSADAIEEEKPTLPFVESTEESPDEEILNDVQSQENAITVPPMTEEPSRGTQSTDDEELGGDLAEKDNTCSTHDKDMTAGSETANVHQMLDTTQEIDDAAIENSSVVSETIPGTVEDQPSTLPEHDDHMIQDSQSVREKDQTPAGEPMLEKSPAIDPSSIDNGSSTSDSLGVSQGLETNTLTTISTNTSGVDAVGESISFPMSEESQGNYTDLPIPGDDNNIIQGLPPNKGKKWKDRLKKKKNKKSEKTGTVTNDDSENGAVTGAADNAQEVSASNNDDEDATAGRPAYNRGISDLTADEKQRSSSPTNDVEPDPLPKAIGKKSNKWKNRLAKMKGSKQDNVKSAEDDIEADVTSEIPTGTSSEGKLLVDFKSPEEISERGQILVDFNHANEIAKSEGEEPMKNQSSVETIDVPEQDSKPDMPILTQTSTPEVETNEQKPKVQNQNLHKNLRQSFDVFDSFLQNGLASPTDDESLYTEVTIGQESMLQSGVPAPQASEEELSYMDFTIEETIQLSPTKSTTPSKIAPAEGKMMSPFMTNLLSSRMFQEDDVVPKMTLPQKEEEPKRKMRSESVDTADTDLKQYPTITVGDDFDDDMTQITMGSLDDHHNEEGEEEFFDAKSNYHQSSTSSKDKNSSNSNSRKSEGASSNSSPVPPCSEASKQRIVEILRKEVWSRDKKVVQSAMEELNAEAKTGYLHRAHIVRCGGVMTIMRAMEMNSNCEPIQIASCSTLEKLSLEPQTQVTICEMEGISLIVRCMQVNVANIELQEIACSALATVSRHHEGDSSKNLMKDAEDAVPTVLSCMTRYPTNSCIQAKGFQAIANLCSGIHAHERLQELSKAGGIMTLTMAIQTPWENKNDQQEAISNLSILLRGITELNEKSSTIPTVDAIPKETKKSQVEPIVREEPSDNDTVNSYMSEIPNMPMMSSSSLNVEEIPDLDDYGGEIPDLDDYGGETPDAGQYPTMMQNFGEDDLDAGRKTSNDPTSPSRGGAQQGGAQGEEQCIIQ